MFVRDKAVDVGMVMVMTAGVAVVTCSSSSSVRTNDDVEPSGATVSITNQLETKHNLQVHCKDKHSDFGVQQVAYGAKYEFHIEPNTFTADYFCGFVFDGDLHWFDIYLAKRDSAACGNEVVCHWDVKRAGPCFTQDNTCYPWNHDDALPTH